MMKELNGNLFLVLPQRKQVLEVIEHYDGFPVGNTVSRLSYVSYRTHSLGYERGNGIIGRMIPSKPLENMTKEELIVNLMEHIYGANAKRVPFILICA